MRIGPLIYKLIFEPTLPIRYNLKHFGLLGWHKIYQGEKRMEKAATNLTPIKLTADFILEVSYLTGAKYWHQTLFCAYSLANILLGRVRINIYSDGTLDNGHKASIEKIIQGVIFISDNQVSAHLNHFLPKEKYPTLRYLQGWHPFFKRLINIHSRPSWSVHLDSDMIFFNYPAQLIDAYTHKKSIYMKEQLDNSYFVDNEDTLKDKYHIPCISFVNGGIIAYDSDKVDYADLEDKAKLLLNEYPNAGPAQVEQTLMSYLLFKQDAEALDKKLYAIIYENKSDLTVTQIVRHYIFKAKKSYFTSEWKKVIH
jgi:hypothetical protein